MRILRKIVLNCPSTRLQSKLYLYHLDASSIAQRDPIDSPTALKSESSIVRQSHRQHICDVREIFKFHLFSFKFTDQTIEIHTLQNDSNNISIYFIFFSQLFAEVSAYRAVGLLICTQLNWGYLRALVDIGQRFQVTACPTKYHLPVT